MAAQRTREEYPEVRLADLAGHWLAIHCGGCGRPVYYPCQLLAKKHGAGLRVADVLPRLRCEHCKARPSRVLMTNFPAGGPQYSDTWGVALLSPSGLYSLARTART
jgi:hypothetical protein